MVIGHFTCGPENRSSYLHPNPPHQSGDYSNLSPISEDYVPAKGQDLTGAFGNVSVGQTAPEFYETEEYPWSLGWSGGELPFEGSPYGVIQYRKGFHDSGDRAPGDWSGEGEFPAGSFVINGPFGGPEPYEGSIGYVLVRTLAIAGVPEPTTILLFGAGLVGLAGFGRKRFMK